MKHLSIRRSLLLGVTVMLLASSSTYAQSTAGRIAFGIDGGGNKYYGNFTDNQFAFHGDAFIRWNILDYLSLHAAYNGGLLKYKSTALDPGAGIGTLSHTRVGGWDLMASYNVYPNQQFVPYVIGGVEALNFEPNDANDKPLPGNAAGAYSKNVLGGVFGVGFELYISNNITFNGKGLLHLTGTDWLDDYSDPKNYRQDAFLSMGVGFSYYIFDQKPKEPVMADNDYDRSSTTSNVTNIYETNVYPTDTVYVKSANDTVYLHRPKVNMVYNFPGTLFLANTDQFNTAAPGNMQHLYNIRELVQQCPEMRIEVQGFASEEGTMESNQSLSERRASRIKSWLIEQGVSPFKIAGTVGYGETRPAVVEHKGGTAAQLESERAQNRRVAIRVVETCK